MRQPPRNQRPARASERATRPGARRCSPTRRLVGYALSLRDLLGEVDTNALADELLPPVRYLRAVVERDEEVVRDGPLPSAEELARRVAAGLVAPQPGARLFLDFGAGDVVVRR